MSLQKEFVANPVVATPRRVDLPVLKQFALPADTMAEDPNSGLNRHVFQQQFAAAAALATRARQDYRPYDTTLAMADLRSLRQDLHAARIVSTLVQQRRLDRVDEQANQLEYMLLHQSPRAYSAFTALSNGFAVNASQHHNAPVLRRVLTYSAMSAHSHDHGRHNGVQRGEDHEGGDQEGDRDD